ncbi:hypothetical protein [Enterococcus sp. AZ172]|uniref:hypothetical protein n=1 Tax=unclassified Enterococcus TaxID=2608891 RepID=UPI003F684E36
MMKKRIGLFSLGLLGVLLTSVLAGDSSTAKAEEKEASLNVGYFAGGVTVDPNASVLIPTGVIFSDTTSKVDTSVQLMAIYPDGPSSDVSGLPNNFKVDVQVQSSNGYTLNNQKYSQKGEYKLGYKVAGEPETFTYYNQNTPDSTGAKNIGTLNNQRQKITGEAQMTTAPKVAALADDLFEDTLTYKLKVTNHSNETQ